MKTINITFGEKNDFVVDNTSAEYFEKDAELYSKTLPTSRLIPELARVNQFNKKELDGRMLMEMLDFVTPVEILENRGVLKKKAPKSPPVELTKDEADELLSRELKDLHYEDKLKPLVKFLKLETENNKKVTLIAALEAYKDSVKAEADKIEADRIAAEKAEADKAEFNQKKADELLLKDPKDLNYEKELKPLVKFLKLETKDLEKATLIAAVETHLDSLIALEIAREEQAEADKGNDPPTGDNAECNNAGSGDVTTSTSDQGSPPGGSPGADKKKEGQK